MISFENANPSSNNAKTFRGDHISYVAAEEDSRKNISYKIKKIIHNKVSYEIIAYTAPYHTLLLLNDIEAYSSKCGFIALIAALRRLGYKVNVSEMINELNQKNNRMATPEELEEFLHLFNALKGTNFNLVTLRKEVDGTEWNYPKGSIGKKDAIYIYHSGGIECGHYELAYPINAVDGKEKSENKLITSSFGLAERTSFPLMHSHSMSNPRRNKKVKSVRPATTHPSLMNPRPSMFVDPPIAHVPIKPSAPPELKVFVRPPIHNRPPLLIKSQSPIRPLAPLHTVECDRDLEKTLAESRVTAELEKTLAESRVTAERERKNAEEIASILLISKITTSEDKIKRDRQDRERQDYIKALEIHSDELTNQFLSKEPVKVDKNQQMEIERQIKNRMRG